MKNRNNKKRISITISLFLMLCIYIFIPTYAYFSKNTETTANSVVNIQTPPGGGSCLGTGTGQTSLSLTASQMGASNENNSEAVTSGTSTPITMTATAPDNTMISCNYDVTWTWNKNYTQSSGVTSSIKELTYVLEKSTDNGVSWSEEKSETLFNSGTAGETITLLSNLSINTSSSAETKYRIKVQWYNNTLDQDSQKNAQISGTLKFSQPTIQYIKTVIVESEHNPYANNIDSVVYYENTFAGASSLTVKLTYQTESTNYDWVYLYTSPSTIYQNKKYGDSTLKTETINIPGNYIKIVFRTDVSVNDFYGFKAEITPN